MIRSLVNTVRGLKTPAPARPADAAPSTTPATVTFVSTSAAGAAAPRGTQEPPVAGP
jgi:hypothetical protein